ncbi:hypothetical protein BGW36DRAFT_441999 [Talaromyces proteolyticus]|uniref:Uncharacterized protein n=1 Tax=Talaromyces proteolyticus TaxID=1131652 RepID=A0AAD4KE23_9EURO|nr:uncharacterized protein BGW36DRAFT_441999 [Talaromyces proteolyticus]KAH8689677.1 hypothetical protein BGW36DRAFT_441999 [Talaromyces proteolyticus]
MTSSFSRLPLEVLIIVLQHAPDLPTIYKFICASASANAAFEISPSHILDNVIERSIPEFKHLARMVAILGSFSASSLHLTFKNLVDKYKNLPKDMLTTAPASFAFEAGTPGPRYLVLTGYRIEILQHICFVSLLQNIHEAAAWWPPSWAEKVIYPDLKTDDYRFSQYSAVIQHINPCIGPDLRSYKNVCHEVEEMKCVLAATYDFLSYTDDLYHLFTPFTSTSRDPHNFHIKKWTSSTISEETSHWRFEEPKPMNGVKDLHNGQHSFCVNSINNGFRLWYWSCWFKDLYERPASKPHSYNPQFPDYLGLCIWDYKRQGYLGLAYMYDGFLDPCLGPLRSPNNRFFTSTRISTRWRDVFMREVVRLPGGQLRWLSKDLEIHIREWDIPERLKDIIDRWRLDYDWGLFELRG